MEIDKKIILKLIQTLEELKNSVKGIKDINIEDKVIEEDLSDEIFSAFPFIII